ncbi:MAG: hypothetical protein J5545_04160 [Bacteroidaceae bacterium]|nr:hypothetical protein [Bacteroidaceae bacterium]
MKNRFSTFGKHTARALCVLTLLGLSWSCKDEYILDDEKPDWLNSSIFEGLEEKGNFSQYLRLLQDKDVNPANARPLKEVLSRTGSKTVFVANDEAWDAFFKRNAALPEENPWHNATSYERLSQAQKKLLIHSSMLNNAIVMENLASSDGSGTTRPIRGEYMRRYTDVMLTDTVTHLNGDQVPYSYGTEPNYWKRFRSVNGGNGLYMVQDSTSNMMLHFTAEHMSKQGVTDADFAIFMGRERKTSDVHIYDALLQEKDQATENGYVNITEKVIAPLPNMAEVIRSNGKTNIFSHMLDRFSFPYYNYAVTESYKTLHPEFTDSIFTKHYFAQIGPGHQSQLVGPDGARFRDDDGEAALKFDPGWNEFYDEVDRRADMASMFVPSDETLWDYFSEGGGGWQLIKTYAHDPYATVTKGDYDALFQKIDDIPLSTLQALINVIMFRSFNGSVPSKMGKLRNDAQEDIFSYEDTKLVRDGGHIDTCYLACNGAVYVMDKVYGPADYTSVAAPAYISKTNLIMKWAIYNGNIEAQDQMHLNYYAYLKAMKSRFTFFLPSDAAMQYYYDPISFQSNRPRVLSLTFTDKGNFPLDKQVLRYDPLTGVVSTPYNNEQMANTDVVNRLKDILESHTIVHTGNNPIDSEDEYYVTKNGAGIKVERDANGTIIAVKGGFQLENERAGIMGNHGLNTIAVTLENTHNMENGRTYVLDDAPIIPTSKSVYDVLVADTSATGPYTAFIDLTTPNVNVIKECGLVPPGTPTKSIDRIVNKYTTFVKKSTSSAAEDYNVQFFNNYRYTLFVPTNEAIQQAKALGMPTWDTISEEYENLPIYEDIWIPAVNGIEDHYVINDNRVDAEGKAAGDTIWVPSNSSQDHCFLHSDSLKFQAKITFLNNFIRGHFLDNSVFADKTETSEADYVTSSYDSELGIFIKVHVQRVKENGQTVLKVRDDKGGSLLTTTDLSNVMARDVQLTRNGTYVTAWGQTTMNNIIIQGSSFCVIHQIPGVLNHIELAKRADGTYIFPWDPDAAPGACKAYLKKHAIPNDIKSLKHYEE